MRKSNRLSRSSADLRRRQIEKHERRRKARRFAKRFRRREARSARRLWSGGQGLIFDGNLEREQIVLPAIFSFRDNFDESASALEQIRQVAMHEKRNFLVHLEQLQEVEPAAALALTSEIFRARKVNGHLSATGTYPRSSRVYQNLSDMGFFSLLDVIDWADRPADLADPRRPLWMRFVTSNAFEQDLVDSFVSLIEAALFPLNPLARGRLVGAIKEAMSNVIDHAHPASVQPMPMRDRWWMTAWLDREQNEVTIIFYDQGVGIPATLDPNDYEIISSALRNISKLNLRAVRAGPSDGEMILAATELHRSGTGRKGRGRGFQDMKRFVQTADDGELQVLSNRGSYRYMGDNDETYSDHESLLGGTVIEWRFRNNAALEMTQ